MSGKQYLKNQLPVILINLLGMLVLALFLIASDNPIQTVLFILAVWSIVLVLSLLTFYFSRKKYLNKLLNMTEQLEERYLLPEIMQVPERADEQVFYQIMKMAEKSMLERIGEVQRERREYKEYIENNDLDIVNKCDFISSNHTDDEIKKYLSDKNSKLDNTLRICKKELQAEIKKRILKRSMIRLMLNGNYQFTKISRKLRSELVSLDGACIIGLKGDVYSFGAIIQNDSGSSGGGRGTAAKKLSAYGMAIKISTDGYIEVYLNQQKIYTIK